MTEKRKIRNEILVLLFICYWVWENPRFLFLENMQWAAQFSRKIKQNPNFHDFLDQLEHILFLYVDDAGKLSVSQIHELSIFCWYLINLFSINVSFIGW